MSKTSLRIGITCYPTFGGSGVVATEIGMEMARRGHKVHFICYDVPRRLDRYIENIFFHEVEVHENPLFRYPSYTLALTSKMVEVANYEKLDLFHVHYAIPHATSAYLARQILGQNAPKIITTLHGTDITLVGNERSHLPITRFSIMESDGVTVPSRFLKMATYDKLNVPSDLPISVIPNFVDTNAFSPSVAGKKRQIRCFLEGCPKVGKVLIHVSNFRPVKRISDIISIFALVNKEVPAHLVLVGDGPERSGAEDQVHKLGLESRVSFVGKQESFVELLQGSDVFLLPSEHESFGLAALEAMSCGLPVVGSNAEGIPEVVDRETGFLSEVGDVNSMAQNVVRLLSDEALLRRMSANARTRVEQNFSRDMLIEQYERYYYSVLGNSV